MLTKQEVVPAQVLEVLRNVSFNENVLLLPQQLDRKLYEAVNKTIDRIGGKWNRKAKGHVFGDEVGNPQELLCLILETGEMPPKNPTSFYPTPPTLAASLIEGMPSSALRTLEPSAGMGNIAQAMRDRCVFKSIKAQIECCEILPRFQSLLREQGFTVVADNFLRYQPEQPYDFIAMNPPFAVEGDPLAYVSHVMHAWEMLAPGGSLVSIVPAGFAFREDRRIKDLRILVESVGAWNALPSQSFQASGTGVNTLFLSMHN